MIEIVDPEHPEDRQRYETWESDSKGTRQCFISVGGREYVVNVYPPKPICEAPEMATIREAVDSVVARRIVEFAKLRPITSRVRHPERP